MEDFEKYKKKQYRSRAFEASFWNIFGTILPFLLCSIILLIYSKPHVISSFIKRGDLFIYSAGLLSGAIYILSDNRKNIKLWYNKILYPSTLVLLIFSAVLYSAVYIVVDLHFNVTLEEVFTWVSSLAFILFAIVITYRSLLIDFKYRPTEFDAVENAEQEVKKITNDI